MLKKIFSNTLAQLVAKFFGAGLTLITTYYTIRLAGLSLYGDLTRILVLVAVGFTAIDFGLNAEAIRTSRSSSVLAQNLVQVALARLFLSCLVVLALNGVVYLLPGGYSLEVKHLFWLGSLAIIFQGIYTSCNVYYQYHLQYWRSTLSVITGSLIYAALTLYYLFVSPTLAHLVTANTLGYLSMALVSFLLLPKLKLSSWSFIDLSQLLSRSLILGLILIASVLASKIDTVILGVFRNSGEVGEYGFAYRIFDVILVLPVFVMNAIYPLTLQSPGENIASKLIRATTKYLSFISLVIAILLWFMAPLVVYIKPELIGTASLLRILALSLPLFYITAPLMWGLIAHKHDKPVLAIYLTATIFNTAINWLLIPHYGATAAAFNTGITELFIFLALAFASTHLP